MKKILTLLLLTLGGVSALESNAQTAEELLTRGREAFLNYNFSEASKLYAQAKKKAKRNDDQFTQRYDEFSRQLGDARNFLDRVENIAIIDSLTVPKLDFFKSYRLPASSGTLSGAEGLPGQRIAGVNYVFTNEGQDYKLWSQPDTTGYLIPMESILMTDGKWSDPTPLWHDLSENSDAAYPFMMSDGVTLYYADNGENSIGGYDIMIATRDALDGSFLKPSNIGFPYNSPYDDYLLAIDELNGVGWWATDRNQLDDELTVYLFVTNDLRKNYSPDEENLISLARIDNIEATQPEDSDYSELLETIRRIDPSKKNRKIEFTLPASGGRTYYSYKELPSAQARSAVKAYLAAKAEFENSSKRLATMRQKYHSTESESLGRQIAEFENSVEKQRKKVDSLKSEVYKALGK